MPITSTRFYAGGAEGVKRNERRGKRRGRVGRTWEKRNRASFPAPSLTIGMLRGRACSHARACPNHHQLDAGVGVLAGRHVEVRVSIRPGGRKRSVSAGDGDVVDLDRSIIEVRAAPAVNGCGDPCADRAGRVEGARLPAGEVMGFAQGVGGGAASGVAVTCLEAKLVPWESVAVTS